VTLRALTIRQPWASLIMAGVKRIENRSYRPRCLGELPAWVAIHAGLGFDKQPDSDRAQIEYLWQECPGWTSADYPTGILGLARIDRVTGAVGGIFGGGPVCWHIGAGARLHHPIPHRGALGLWRVPDDVADGIGLVLEDAWQHGDGVAGEALTAIRGVLRGVL